MLEVMEFFWWVFVPWFVAIFIGLCVFLVHKSWNIPIVILRFTGDKRRPMLLQTKGKKKTKANVPYLMVRGYHRAFRDFFSENYYPSPKTKFGGLILFEFEDGWLTPLRPAWRKLTEEDRAKVVELLKPLYGMRDVTFEYDKLLHDKLKLQVVDDVDSDFFLQQQIRLENQYKGAWSWFTEHAGIFLTALVVICLLIGFILWLKENPQNSAQICVSAMRDVCGAAGQSTSVAPDAEPGLLERAAGAIKPPG